MKQKTWIIIAGVLIIAFVFFSTPRSSELPAPGQEFSAITGTCWGSEVLVYGRPSYASDESVIHMSGHPCYTSEQCWNWPPESYVGEVSEIYCCVPLGECVVNV